jgi:hypothetical protein
MAKKTIAAATTLALVAYASLWYTAREREAALPPRPTPPNTALARWAHRQNSLEALDRARAAGFAGVELDIHFDGARGLVVGHDPTDSPRLGLHDALARHGAAFSYWLDFKGLDVERAHAAAPLLDASVQALRLAQRVWVEANDRPALLALRARVSGLRVIARTSPWERLRPGLGYLSLLGDLAQSPLDAVSWRSDAIDAATRSRLGRVALFAFGPADAPTLARLDAAGVDVVLVDADTTAAR